MQPLKLVIVGCGAIVENNHLPALRKCPEWELACLVDLNRERVESLARRYGCQGFTDITKIPEGVDAVLVAVPNYLHGNLVQHFLQNYCHVLCEKPLTITLDEGNNLLTLSGSRRRVLVVGHQLRFLPCVQQLREMLRARYLGSIQSVDLAMGWASQWQSVTNFYKDHALAGGGVMMDLGCHLLDLAFYLFGDLKNAEFLSAEFDVNSKSLEKAINIELTFVSGFKGLVRVSRLTNLHNAIAVYGELGHVTASLESATLDIMLPSMALCAMGRAARLKLVSIDPFVSLWKNFYRAIREGTQAAPDLCYADLGVQHVQIIEQLYQQMRCYVS